MIEAIRGWLTPEVRKAIYTITAGALAVLVTVGVISPDMIEGAIETLVLIGGFIAVLTNLLASINTNVDND